MASRTLGGIIQHSWNAFRNKDPSTHKNVYDTSATKDRFGYWPGSVSYSRPDVRSLTARLDKTFAVAIYSRIAADVTRATFMHVRADENGRYQDVIDDGLHQAIRYEANIDQSAQDFWIELIMSLLDEGYLAVVPVDTTRDPEVNGSYDILSMRVGKIIAWHPAHVEVDLYDERDGQRKKIPIAKNAAAILYNPFYSVMNERNSILQRLLNKLAQLDVVDDATASGKLDVIIQLPYVVKNRSKAETAEERRKALEDQLNGSKLGVGYIDGTERIVQLNRSVENNLLEQIQYLTSMLYSQLGLTEEIMNGTANESTMLNYYNRTINVLLDAIVQEFERKFLTKTARTQGQRIMYFRDPFALTPSTQIADIADKFTRNEILSSNEMRGVVGFKPSDDPKADELRNSNLNESNPEEGQSMEEPTEYMEGDNYEE